MPYKASGKNVLVFKNGKWVLYKRHTSAEKARRHAAALNINVRHK